MEKTSLRALSMELVTLMDRAEEATTDGEEPFNLEEAMDALMEKMSGKMDSLIDYIFHLSGDIAGIDAKIKHLQDVKKIKTNRIASLERYLKRVMDMQGVVEMDTGEHILKLKKNPVAMEIVDATAVPKQYYNYAMVTTMVNITAEELERYKAITKENPKEGVEYVFTEELDKAVIKEVLKAGEEVPGAKLTQGIRLEIK